MKCPYCGVAIPWVPNWNSSIGSEGGRFWFAETQECAGCHRLIVQLVKRDFPPQGTAGTAAPELERVQALPRASQRPPPPPEAPEAIKGDYREACLVLADSPKASAALSRRCLQAILRDAAQVKQGNLDKEIDQVLAGHQLPSVVAKSLDAVRSIGNFAAHPTKSTNTGEVIDVEPHEAEWNLDVLEALMDIYYVQPVQLEAKLAALNVKLDEAGKSPV